MARAAADVGAIEVVGLAHAALRRQSHCPGKPKVGSRVREDDGITQFKGSAAEVQIVQLR